MIHRWVFACLIAAWGCRTGTPNTATITPRPAPAPGQIAYASTPYAGVLAVGVLEDDATARARKLYDDAVKCAGRQDVPFEVLRFVIVKDDSIPRWLVKYDGPPVMGVSVGPFIFISEHGWTCDRCLRHELTHSVSQLDQPASHDHSRQYFREECDNLWS